MKKREIRGRVPRTFSRSRFSTPHHLISRTGRELADYKPLTSYSLGRYFYFCCPRPIYYLRPSFSPSLVVRDPGSHSSLFSPLPTTERALRCFRAKTSVLSSLVDSSRIPASWLSVSRSLPGIFRLARYLVISSLGTTVCCSGANHLAVWVSMFVGRLVWFTIVSLCTMKPTKAS